MKTVTVCIVAALAFLSSPNSSGQQSSGLVYIEGTVTRADQSPLPGATISLSNGSTFTTNRSGHYFAVLPAGFSGSITASLSGYTLSPSVRSYSNLSTDQLHQDFAGGTYAVSGTVGSRGIQEVSLYFDSSGQGVTTESGYFSVLIPQGYSGNVIPLSPDTTFIPSSSPFPGYLSFGEVDFPLLRLALSNTSGLICNAAHSTNVFSPATPQIYASVQVIGMPGDTFFFCGTTHRES